MPTTARLNKSLGLLAFFIAATALLAGPVLGQANLADRKGEIEDGDCYSHHREEGYRSMDLFPDQVQEVAKGQPFEFKVTIVNPWRHDMLRVSAFVNTSNAPGFRFPGEKPPEEKKWDGVLAQFGDRTFTEKFRVAANATEIVARVEGEPGGLRGNVFDLEITDPRQQLSFKSPPGDSQKGIKGETTPWRTGLRIPYDGVARGGTGEWKIAVKYGGPEAQAKFTLVVNVYYNLSKATEMRVRGPDLLKQGQSHTFSFTLIAPDAPASKVDLRYGGITINHHKHTDPNAEDYGNVTKWETTSFKVGSTTVSGQGTIIAIGPDASPLMRAWGQVLGIASGFLLVPALVLGGTFGPKSVAWLNNLLQPRRRVLWHNATSYLLLAVALIHVILLLAENYWQWSHGMVWGGLALAAMIGLGFNGGMQKRFVARWGFNRWRFTHFTLGILCVVFTMVHSLADGSHLTPVLKMMGFT